MMLCRPYFLPYLAVRTCDLVFPVHWGEQPMCHGPRLATSKHNNSFATSRSQACHETGSYQPPQVEMHHQDDLGCHHRRLFRHAHQIRRRSSSELNNTVAAVTVMMVVMGTSFLTGPFYGRPSQDSYQRSTFCSFREISLFLVTWGRAGHRHPVSR